jgi:hypothetical protein
MRRLHWTTWAALGALLIGGCASGPLQENPVLVRPAKVGGCENPLYVEYDQKNGKAYDALFDKIIDVVDDYWDIAFVSRHGGLIETYAKVAPGLGQPWKPGSPDVYQRTLASFQSIRHRAIVVIRPADVDGYFIDVKVLKELEDLPAPQFATAGSASFRSFPTVERQYEVIDASLFDPNWIPMDRAGRPLRDHALEQVILERIAKIDLSQP